MPFRKPDHMPCHKLDLSPSPDVFVGTYQINTVVYVVMNCSAVLYYLTDEIEDDFASSFRVENVNKA